MDLMEVLMEIELTGRRCTAHHFTMYSNASPLVINLSTVEGPFPFIIASILTFHSWDVAEMFITYKLRIIDSHSF